MRCARCSTRSTSTVCRPRPRSGTGSSTAGPTTRRRNGSTRPCSPPCAGWSRSPRCTCPASSRSSTRWRTTSPICRRSRASTPRFIGACPRWRNASRFRARESAELRRYGFHGLSYEYIVGVLGTAGTGRTIIAHLGNGASLVALQEGHPVDTTMGLTPLGGVVMGTRTGDLDPGVLLYLMREKGYDARRLERLVGTE